jgi:hypothetical protein
MALGTTGTVVIAALVAGFAGAGAALAVRGGDAPPSSIAADARRIADLEERLSKQDGEIRGLQARLEEVSRAAPAPAAPAVAPEAAVLGPDGSPVEGGSDGPGGAPPVIGAGEAARRDRIRGIRGAMRERTEGDSAEKRRKSIEDGVRARLDAMPAELNFTPATKDEVVRAVAERAEKLRTIFEEARASGGPDAMRGAQEKAEQARKESRDALQAIMTPEQFAAFERTADRGQAAGGGGGAGRRGVRGGAGNGAPPAGGGAPR